MTFAHRIYLRVKLALPLVGWLCLFPMMVSAQNSPAPSLQEISRKMSQVESVCTHFVQERNLSLFDKPLRSEGWLCFQKPGRIRWQVQEPYESILVSDGRAVAQFEKVDGKWKKLDIGLANAMQSVVSQIAGVMNGSYTTSQNEYTVLVTNAPDAVVITLSPKNEKMRAMIKAIEVHLATDLNATRRVILRENGDDFTDIRFDQQRVNGKFPDLTFDRNAPADIEKITKPSSGPSTR